MPTNFDSADAASPAVKSFLSEVGRSYLGRPLNFSSKKGKEEWERIKNKFDNTCAYCNEKETFSGSQNRSSLEKEHLYMMNRQQVGLHHPGNIVPACYTCNKRKRLKVIPKVDGKGVDVIYETWEDVLRKKSEKENYIKNKNRIEEHMISERYPKLDKKELSTLKAITQSLYEGIQNEVDTKTSLYKQIAKII